MSHFYGSLRGTAGEATRTGTKQSGMQAIAASFQGAVSAYAYLNDAGQDCVRIRFIQWNGQGRHLTLYDGPIYPSDDQIFAAMVRHAPAALGTKDPA